MRLLFNYHLRETGREVVLWGHDRGKEGGSLADQERTFHLDVKRAGTVSNANL
jgi:hypothetical protein